MPFRVQGKFIFLTYSQANFDTNDFQAHLLSKGGIRRIIICSEKHSDGNEHRHAGIEFESRRDIRNERLFDFKGFHPSIERAKNWKKCVRYCRKDGEYSYWPEDEQHLSSGSEEEEADPGNFDKEQDWLRYCISKNIGYGFANRLWELSKVDHGTVIDEFTEILGTISDNRLGFERPARDKCSVVIGPTGVGKTTWAKRYCIKPTLWVRHIDELRRFNGEFHNSIIFDDMTFSHQPVTAQIHLVDQDDDSAIHCRYKVAKIPKDTQKIFTCNVRPFSENAAIDRRIHVINLN